MGESTTVLHVDDEPRFGELTRTFLERENDRFVVETVASADAGLERVDDCPPDCVVSDYNMPGMDGLAFLQAVRDTHPDLPFILFTGKGSEEVASDAIAAGVTDYIQKGSGSERYALLANRIENAVESRREAKRADRQEQLMRLTEFAGDTGGFELDTETGEVVMTDGTRRILNLPEQANPDFERNLRHYHPDDREKIRQTIQRALQTGEQTRGTWRYQHPDAEEKLVEITYTPVTANGDTTTIRGAVCDITDRRERQRELRQLQQAIDNANVPITLADPSREDEPLVYVNNGFEEMTGYAPEEARGRNCRFLQGEDTDPEKVAALREAIDNEESISVELRNYRKNGTEFWNRLTVSPIYDDDDNLVRYLGTQEDITERKERERELGAERRRFRALVEESNDIISVMDAAGVFQYQSPSIERILGYDPEETIGDTAWEYIHPDDRTELVEAFERWTDQPDANPVVEYRARHADGSWRWLEARGNNQLDNPAVEGYVINSRDITPRKERTQERDRAWDLMTSMEKSADIGAWEYNPETETTVMTDGLRRVHGLDPGAGLSLNDAFEAFHPDDRDALTDRFEQCLETGESYELDVRLTTPDGEQRWVTAGGERVEREKFGTVIRGYLQDTTEKRRQRLQLEQKTARLEVLFDRSPDMINVHDSDGNILEVNQQLAERTGYTKSELSEMKVWDLDTRLTPDDARTVWREMEPDDRRQLEGVYDCRDGSTLPVEVHVRRLDIEDEDSFVVISRDITEQTEREQRLSTQNKRLDEFASIVSHDLRTPLGVAEGHLELAQDTCESKHLAKAANAIDRSQTLIDDLSTLAREGKAVAEVEPVALADVAERSWQTTETGSATLEIDTAQAIRADRSRLQELFENLYRNAVEHGGDDVTVSVEQTSSGFCVSDTGSGVPETEREAVFEAGYSTDADGTGFGLRIVERIAEAHGWDVAVGESEQGGARFEFTGDGLTD